MKDSETLPALDKYKQNGKTELREVLAKPKPLELFSGLSLADVCKLFSSILLVKDCKLFSSIKKYD